MHLWIASGFDALSSFFTKSSIDSFHAIIYGYILEMIQNLKVNKNIPMIHTPAEIYPNIRHNLVLFARSIFKIIININTISEMELIISRKYVNLLQHLLLSNANGNDRFNLRYLHNDGKVLHEK